MSEKPLVRRFRSSASVSQEIIRLSHCGSSQHSCCGPQLKTPLRGVFFTLGQVQQALIETNKTPKIPETSHFRGFLLPIHLFLSDVKLRLLSSFILVNHVDYYRIYDASSYPDSGLRSKKSRCGAKHSKKLAPFMNCVVRKEMQAKNACFP